MGACPGISFLNSRSSRAGAAAPSCRARAPLGVKPQKATADEQKKKLIG
jgi:hypothetical protein